MVANALHPSSEMDGVAFVFLAWNIGVFFAVLFWCASIGDEFQRVQRLLNQPAVVLGLKGHLGGMEEATNFMGNYVQRLDLGFKLFNVTLPTQRVLSLLASIFFTLIIASTGLYSAFRSDGRC